MSAQEFVCSKCGATVSKRKSRLVGNGRICKIHDEAQEHAEKEHAKFVKKMNRATEEIAKMSNRHRPADPMRQLAAFAMLGQLYREQQEARMVKMAQATEMMFVQFKSSAFGLFFDTLNKLHMQDVVNGDKRAIIQKAFDDFKIEIVATGRTHEEIKKIAELWDEATDGFIDRMFEKFEKDDVDAESNSVIAEWKTLKDRYNELYEIFFPGKIDEEQRHREMIAEQAEAIEQLDDYSGLT